VQPRALPSSCLSTNLRGETPSSSIYRKSKGIECVFITAGPFKKHGGGEEFLQKKFKKFFLNFFFYLNLLPSARPNCGNIFGKQRNLFPRFFRDALLAHAE
jgi:hypothetical protein